MRRILFTNAHLLVDGKKEYLNGALLVKGETIEDVFVNTKYLKKDLGNFEEIDLKGKIVMPAFFDIHNHYVDDTDLAIKATGSYLQTSGDIHSSMIIENKYARNLGIHLEGPFINDVESRHNLEELIEILDSVDNIRQMSIAPEIQGSEIVIEELRKRKIKVMFGNSKAINEDVYKYHDGYTHLFIKTLGLLSKDISLTNLAFEDDKYVEVLADENYVNRSVLRLILKNIKKDKIMLVSNASVDHKLYISDEIKIMKNLGASLSDILLMSSLNAYRFLKLDNRFGSLIKGKYSDIVILDDELNVVASYIKGEMLNA